MNRAKFAVEPRYFIRHTEEWQFAAPDVIEVRPGELWLFTQWGRNPTDFAPGDARSTDPFVILKSFDGGETWEEQIKSPIAWTIDGFRADGGISVARLKSGKLMAVCHRHGSRFGRSGSHGVPVMSLSADNGQSWSPWQCIFAEENEYYVMNHRLVQLTSGTVVLPVSLRDPDVTHDNYGEGASPTAAALFLSDDEGGNWRRAQGMVRQPTQRGVQEPCVAEIGDRRLVMLFRSGKGAHQICFSDDRGHTWSVPEATSLTAACSPLTLHKLPDGRLLLLYNHATPLFAQSYYPRNPLVYALSENDGATWSDPVLIDDAPQQQLIYPCVTPTSRGLLVVYSAHHDPGDGSFSASQETVLIGGGKLCIVDANI